MNIAETTAYPVNMPESVAFQIATGRVAEAARDAGDIRSDQQTTIINTRIVIPRAGGEITAKQPPAVAIPLPPFLNFI